MWLIIIITIVLAAVFYFTVFESTKYWEKQNVPSIKPWPYLGNMADTVLRRRAFPHVIDEIYKAFSDKRYCGLYNLSGPALMLRDPELIKQITVKHFETFPQHREIFPDDIDPLWSNNLFAMRAGEKWQNMRSILSPSFTSNKLRLMFELMKECSEQFCNYYLKQDGMVVVELKDAFSRYTNDVIATTALGVSCDSLENRKNEFYSMAKKITTFTGVRAVIFFLTAISPIIPKILNIPVFPAEVSHFFSKVIKETLRMREEKEVIRPDMIHLLMEAKKNRPKTENQTDKVNNAGFAAIQEFDTGETSKKRKPEITDDDIVAQALIFFFAGFDTVSTMLCYACYEMALQPEIQGRLRKEVDQTLEKSGGKLSYENLMGMKYLDMVVGETLRKWPPFVVTGRESVLPHIVEPETPDEEHLYLPKGTNCTIPIYSIHRDPKYYPEPDEFDPERFDEEHKVNINPFTYLPFGAGPRNCIGARFALMEGKLIIAEIISKFEILPTEKTQIPIELSKRTFHPVPDGGFWLALKPRFKKGT